MSRDTLTIHSSINTAGVQDGDRRITPTLYGSVYTDGVSTEIDGYLLLTVPLVQLGFLRR